MDSPPEPLQSTLNSFLSTPTPSLSRRSENRRIDATLWILSEHPTNIRRGSHTSDIWQYGAAYINHQTPNNPPSWICNLCDAILTIPRSQSTSNISRHLQRAHQISVKRKRVETEDTDKEEEESQIQPDGFNALVTRINVDRFHELLVRWVVQR